MGSTEIYLLGIVVMILLIGGIFWATDLNRQQQEVIIYVAHDQDYSEPILELFEERTGIKVRALYDTELTKTVGMVNKLIAEKSNPQADVFWNNEVSRSIQLKNEDALEPYCSANAADIPSDYKDGDCYWTGFAARARVIVYNTELVTEEEAPSSFLDFKDEKWEGKACIANPLFGTTGSHVAAIFALYGDEEAKQFFMDLKNNRAQIVSSNSMVRDQVVSGDCLIGITDTDDAYDGIIEGKPIEMIFPDQGEDGIGTLIIPNSVMLLKDAPNEANARLLIDFLLSKEIEEDLAKTKAMQMPTRVGVITPSHVPNLNDLKGMSIDDNSIYEKLEISREFVQEQFIV